MLYSPLWLYGDASHLCISQRAIDSVDSTWLCTGLFDARFMYLSARPSLGALSRRRAPGACRSSAPPPALLALATVAQVIAATSRLAPAGVQLESPPADRLLAAGTRALQPASSEKGGASTGRRGTSAAVLRPCHPRGPFITIRCFVCQAQGGMRGEGDRRGCSISLSRGPEYRAVYLCLNQVRTPLPPPFAYCSVN